MLLLLTLIGCQNLSLKVKDGEFCSDIGEYGASCDHTLSSQPRDLTKPEWDELRYGQVCADISVIENWRANLLKACTEIKCSYEEQQTLRKISKKIDKMRLKINAYKTQNIIEASE